jgi:hypothetical protein
MESLLQTYEYVKVIGGNSPPGSYTPAYCRLTAIISFKYFRVPFRLFTRRDICAAELARHAFPSFARRDNLFSLASRTGSPEVKDGADYRFSKTGDIG